MKGNINLISYGCYQQATEKQLAYSGSVVKTKN